MILAYGMTVYFDHRVQFPNVALSAGASRHHLMSWHCSFPILAVSSKNEKSDTDGSVNFFLDEVEFLSLTILSC